MPRVALEATNAPVNHGLLNLTPLCARPLDRLPQVVEPGANPLYQSAKNRGPGTDLMATADSMTGRYDDEPGPSSAATAAAAPTQVRHMHISCWCGCRGDQEWARCVPASLPSADMYTACRSLPTVCLRLTRCAATPRPCCCSRLATRLRVRMWRRRRRRAAARLTLSSPTPSSGLPRARPRDPQQAAT